MQTITKYLVLMVLCLNVQFINAQDSVPRTSKDYKIESLKVSKENIKAEERNFLKEEVEAINERLDKKEITFEESEKLKKEAAKKRALNIENRLAIIDNEIALLERNGYKPNERNADIIRIGKGNGDTSDSFIYFGRENDDKPKDYDRRISSDLVLAFGLNNAIIEGEKLDDSPYKFGGSRFFEIGLAWKWRVFEKTNAVRLKNGFSFQMNGLKPSGNRYFTKEDGQTVLKEFPNNLNKSKLTISNLVLPVHFEFGPSKKIEGKDYFRYSTHDKFKFGIGGYVGFNIGTRQKLKYKVDGQKQKDKIKGGLNSSGLVYGLSSYVAFGSTALYLKYDLSPIFKDQLVKQNNISFGVRFDMD